MNDIVEQLYDLVMKDTAPEDLDEFKQFYESMLGEAADTVVTVSLVGSLIDASPIDLAVTYFMQGGWEYRKALSEVDPAAVIATDRYLKGLKDEQH